MRFRLFGVRTTGVLLLTAVALVCTACTAADNGPLDPHASASLPEVSSPAQSTSAPSADPSIAPATLTTKTATTTRPIRTFASKRCHDTVFAQVPGNQQYGFTSCGQAPYNRIFAIVGDGLHWKLTPLSAHGVPLAAAGAAYLLYSAGPGNISVLHRADGKVNTFSVQQGRPNSFVGAIASAGGWWANWSEPYFHRVWQAHTLKGHETATVSSATYAQHLSLAMVGGRPVLASVESGGLYVGTPKGATWTRSKVTSSRVGAPVVFKLDGRTAVAYPDYSHNSARLAVATKTGWSIRSLGDLGSSDTSLVSAGAGGDKAVVAWQTAKGLGLARLTAGQSTTKLYSTAKDRALAATGRAVVREDGSVLLLGTRTSRVIG